MNNLIQAAASNTVVDLSSMIVSQERSISLEIVADNAFIAWEMDLEAAQLIVSETTTKFFAAYFLPLKGFLDLILKNSGIPLDFPEAFEIMLMKRFQEMFVEKLCPKDVLSSFFNLLGVSSRSHSVYVCSSNATDDNGRCRAPSARYDR